MAGRPALAPRRCARSPADHCRRRLPPGRTTHLRSVRPVWLVAFASVGVIGAGAVARGLTGGATKSFADRARLSPGEQDIDKGWATVPEALIVGEKAT